MPGRGFVAKEGIAVIAIIARRRSVEHRVCFFSAISIPRSGREINIATIQTESTDASFSQYGSLAAASGFQKRTDDGDDGDDAR
jgi:hypothetical protein